MKTISISGAVAAGKTTLLQNIMERLGDRAMAHEERPQDNPFIREYYADSKRWSFHSQITFLALYFDDDSWKGTEKEFYFFDRCLVENLVLARYRREAGDLTDNEYAVIEKMAHGLESLMPPVDKYICLRCSVPLLVRRFHERGREYEKNLGWEYAEKLNLLYEEWYKTLPQDRVLFVNEDENIDYDAVLRFIEA